MAVTDIELDVELLKKEVSDMKEIHGRLDTAITKITDVSNCINRMLAVHEEKISQQEEVQVRQATEFSNDVKELLQKQLEKLKINKKKNIFKNKIMNEKTN